MRALRLLRLNCPIGCHFFTFSFIGWQLLLPLLKTLHFCGMRKGFFGVFFLGTFMINLDFLKLVFVYVWCLIVNLRLVLLGSIRQIYQLGRPSKLWNLRNYLEVLGWIDFWPLLRAFQVLRNPTFLNHVTFERLWCTPLNLWRRCSL